MTVSMYCVLVLLLATALAAPGTGPPINPSDDFLQRTIGTGCVTFTLDPPTGSVLSLTPTIKITFNGGVEMGFGICSHR